jgi:hypothetical protein
MRDTKVTIGASHTSVRLDWPEIKLDERGANGSDPLVQRAETAFLLNGSSAEIQDF